MNVEEFITRVRKHPWPRNGHVEEPGFSTLYVRLTERFIHNKRYENVLDIASVVAIEPGKGAFTALVKRLRAYDPTMHLYVESVLNVFFVKRLTKLGFELLSHTKHNPCFFLEAGAPLKETT